MQVSPVIGLVLLCCLQRYDEKVCYTRRSHNKGMHFNHGTMLTRSNTLPVPSEFLTATGCSNGWNESAQQSKGVSAPGWVDCCFLSARMVRSGRRRDKIW